MTKKLEKYDLARQIAEDNIDQQLVTQSTTIARDRALVFTGAVTAVAQIASKLSAQTIRGLQTMRDEKLFEQMGFTRFDDFLNDSEFSPMTYRQFHDREKLLAAEGDRLFDILQTSNLTHKQRRLLGNGNVQIDEEKGTVVISTGDDTEEEIELTDRNRLIQTLSALADQAAIAQTKNARQKTQIEKGERQVEELRKQLDEAKNRPGTTSLFNVFMAVNDGLRVWAEMVVKAEDFERDQSRLYLGELQTAVQIVADAYSSGEAPAAAFKAKRKKTDGEEFEPTLADEDLAGFME